MAWHRHHNDLVPFPFPWRDRDAYYPNVYRDWSGAAFGVQGPHQRRYGWKSEKGVAGLQDKDTPDCAGDLGWSLEYATAWCYRHLVGNRPEIADMIDNVRELDEVNKWAPYLIFEYLDQALFNGKLRGIIYLRWKSQASCSLGTTSAPGIVGSRATIELNSTPFEDEEADMDDLLEALIHHMIHAFFLVCCGAQTKGDKQDGRLMDGLHFGVILLTIRDITKMCADGPLRLIFHASKRRVLEGHAPLMGQTLPVGGLSILSGACHGAVQPYISLDPRGSAIPPAAADGKTHCMHDNSKISWQQIKNWQVEEYSRAIGLEMDSKGDEIWNFDEETGKLEEADRLKSAPSATYAELVWDGKHVMVSRKKALEFDSIAQPMHKYGSYELEIPKCDQATFKCIHAFISTGNDRSSLKSELAVLKAAGTSVSIHHGPPVLLNKHALNHPTRPASLELHPLIELEGRMLTHIKVFKIAEAMKFEELQHHAMELLWSLPATYENPIPALNELYSVDDGKEAGPIHSELHKWAREFFITSESASASALRDSFDHRRHRLDLPSGRNNYHKLRKWYGAEFEKLLLRSQACRDDVSLVLNGRHHSPYTTCSEPPWSPSPTLTPSITDDSPCPGPRSLRSQSFLGIEGRRRAPSPLRLTTGDRVPNTSANRLNPPIDNMAVSGPEDADLLAEAFTRNRHARLVPRPSGLSANYLVRELLRDEASFPFPPQNLI